MRDEKPTYELPAIELLGEFRDLTGGDKKSSKADHFNSQIPKGPGS